MKIDPEFAATRPMLISQEEYDRLKGPEPHPNLMVRLHGIGPTGAKCKTCVHLFRKHMGGTYLKCGLRDDLTGGPATDQKAGWDACSKYKNGKNQDVYLSH